VGGATSAGYALRPRGGRADRGFGAGGAAGQNDPPDRPRDGESHGRQLDQRSARLALARASASPHPHVQAFTRRWIQSTMRIFGSSYMGDDDRRLRWPWLYGLSTEVKASIDDRLIHNHWARIEKPPSFGRLSFQQERDYSTEYSVITELSMTRRHGHRNYTTRIGVQRSCPHPTWSQVLPKTEGPPAIVRIRLSVISWTNVRAIKDVFAIDPPRNHAPARLITLPVLFTYDLHILNDRRSYNRAFAWKKRCGRSRRCQQPRNPGKENALHDVYPVLGSSETLRQQIIASHRC
jgi:hypothetical protein